MFSFSRRCLSFFIWALLYCCLYLDRVTYFSFFIFSFRCLTFLAVPCSDICSGNSFGLADFVLENSFGEKSTCGMYGTPFFVAPEVIRAETYTPAVDIWSLGVLVYNMLSGKLPFDGSHIKEVLRKVRAGRYEFPSAEWRDISDEAKQFIDGLLELDPHNRLTAQKALAHPWLNNDHLSSRPIQNDRSALGYDQRKLRMSSMAIDDVAALLDMDDEDGDDSSRTSHGHGNGSGLSALTRLFPGRSSSAKGPGSGGGSASSSRQSNPTSPSSSRNGRPPRHDSTASRQSFSTSGPPGTAGRIGSPGTTRRRSSEVGVVRVPRQLRQDAELTAPSAARPPTAPHRIGRPGGGGYTNTPQHAEQGWLFSSAEDVLPPLHPLVASGKINADAGNADSLTADDIDPFGHRHDNDGGRPLYQGRANGGDRRDSEMVRRPPPSDSVLANPTKGQEEDASGYSGGYNLNGGGHYGGLEANPGFALPAILSAKAIRQQRKADASGEELQRPPNNGYRSFNGDSDHSDLDD